MSHYIYILASYRGTIYTGMTSNLSARLEQHASGAISSFTSKYKANRLVYVEVADSAEAAFTRERQIKSWRREKRVALIESVNPQWKDLSAEVLG